MVELTEAGSLGLIGAVGGIVLVQDFELDATPEGLVAADDGKLWLVGGTPTGVWDDDDAAGLLARWDGVRLDWQYVDPVRVGSAGVLQVLVAGAATTHPGARFAYSASEEEWFPLQPLWSATEHWTGLYRNGEKVYSKVIDFGAMPNATTKNVAHEITGLDITYANAPLWTGVMSNGTATVQLSGSYFAVAGTVSVLIQITDTNVSIVASANVSTYSAVFRLEYLKTA